MLGSDGKEDGEGYKRRLNGPPFVVCEGYVRNLRDRVGRQLFRMRLYVVHGVGGRDSDLVEREITRLVLGARDEDILP